MDRLPGLLEKSPGERIKYVRNNLRYAQEGKERTVNQDDFALSVGATSKRQATIRWEKGGVPRDFAAAIAALTPYPVEAFLGDATEGVSWVTIDLRLRALEATVDGMAQATALSLESLASAIAELSARLLEEEPGNPHQATG